MSEVKRKFRTSARRGEGEFFKVGGIDGAGAREGAVLEVEVSFSGGDKSGRCGNREGAVSEDNITGGSIIRGRDGDGVSKRDILNNGKEEVEELDELSTPTLQSYRKKARAQGNAIVDKMKVGGGDWSKDQKDTKTLRKRAAGAQMSGKTLRKRGESLKTEEVEQIDELSAGLAARAGDAADERVRKMANKRKWGQHASPLENKLRRQTRKFDNYADKKQGYATEEVEQIDELSQDAVKNYANRAFDQSNNILKMRHKDLPKSAMKAAETAKERRRKGIVAAGKRLGQDTMIDIASKAANRVREEVEQIDELSAKTLGSYVSKAARSAGSNIAGAVASGMANGNKDDQRSMGRNYAKRLKGIDTAAKKLTKEDVINRAVEKYSPSEEERLSLDEQLVARIEDMQESHIHLILNLFEQLDESNQRNLLDMIDQGRVNEVLDFAISAVRGE